MESSKAIVRMAVLLDAVARSPHGSGKWTFTLLAILLVGGCAVGPDYVPPQPEMPGGWVEPADFGISPTNADMGSWWSEFGDPVLDSLVDRARQENLDLELAAARIVEARARYGVAKADWLPDLDGTGGYSRGRSSDSLSAFDIDEDDLMTLGFDVAWELDVFGRIRRSVEAAKADIEFSQEDYRDVLVSLTAEVASSYVMLRSFQARLAIARANVALQNESLGIAQTRFDTGLAPELDVFQARTNLADTESQIPDLEAGIAFSINRIAVLLGEFPGALRAELTPVGSIPRAPAAVATGVPADLVRRRPDIRRAERQLARQTALIGVATADLYPRFTLNGFFSLDADKLTQWFKGESIAWSFGPAFRWNLFQGGAIRNNIEATEQQTVQAGIIYDNTLLLAVEEVENAITSYTNERERNAALVRAATASARTVELSSDLYRRGLTNYQNVLDALRSQLSFDLQRVESEGSAVLSLIRLYRALGGGWRIEPVVEDGVEPAE